MLIQETNHLHHPIHRLLSLRAPSDLQPEALCHWPSEPAASTWMETRTTGEIPGQAGGEGMGVGVFRQLLDPLLITIGVGKRDDFSMSKNEEPDVL